MVAWTAVAILAAGAVGCGPPPRPFAHATEVDNSLLQLVDPVGIALTELRDFPPPAQKPFLDTLIDQLHRADVPAVFGRGNAQSFRVSGQVLHRPTDGGQEVLIHWRMADATGQARGNFVVRRVVAASTWEAGDPALLRELARASSTGIVSLLPDRRPADAAPLQASVPSAPSPVEPVNKIVPPMGTQTKIDAGQVSRGPLGAASQANVPGREELRTKPSAPLPAVALRRIAGAPGDGGESLRTALQAMFRLASIEIVDEDANPGAIIAAEILVRPAGTNQQDVLLRWTVYGPDGRQLGTVDQSNRIRAGQLDGPWGDIAYAVAEGAAQGLSQLLPQAIGEFPAAKPSGAKS